MNLDTERSASNDNLGRFKLLFEAYYSLTEQKIGKILGG